MLKSFLKYVLPSMLAFAFSGVYAIVDGFFVGRNVGDAGLAAINIAYPLAALIQAVGTGIGMGGAVHLSISRGSGDRESAGRYIGNSFTLLLGAGVVLTLGLLAGYGPLLRAFGAQGQTLMYAQEYIRIIIYGTVFQLMATGLIPLLRNLGLSMQAMLCMVAGFLTNIALDYLFVAVLPYGIAGAAWATILGQIVTVVPSLCLLFSRKYRVAPSAYALRGPAVKNILTTGISPFGLTLSPNIVLMIINKSAAVYGGSDAVAAYAVVSYVFCVVQLLLQGVGDGSQPLISEYLGEGRKRAADKICGMAYAMAGIVAVVCLTAIVLLREELPPFFGTSPEVTVLASSALLIFAFCSLPVAFLRVTTSYFYATRRNGFSYLLVYGEPALLFGLMFLLPRIWSLDGVWWGVPVTQATLVLVGVLLLILQGRSARRERA